MARRKMYANHLLLLKYANVIVQQAEEEGGATVSDVVDVLYRLKRTLARHNAKPKAPKKKVRCTHIFDDNGICTHCGDDKDYYCAPPPVVNRVKIKARSVTKGER